jgi:peptide/nickel transport system substrate-binding protein
MRSKFKAGLFASSLALIASTCVMAPSLAGAAPQKALNLDNEQGELWPCAFTPFNGFDAQFSIGVTYETLDFINALQNQKTTPWLATAYAWSNNNKTLTFTIRSGVKFSDGTPFSAADVAYSFNLLKKYPALDLNAIWSVLSSVTQSGSDKVVLNF